MREGGEKSGKAVATSRSRSPRSPGAPAEPASPGAPNRAQPLEAPTLAFFAAFLGGVFVLLDGLVLIGAGSAAFSVGYLLPPADASELGGLGVALGVAIVATAFFFHENLSQRKHAGIILLGLGVASIACGAGFLVGFALTLVAALLGIFRTPPLLYPPPPPSRGRAR